MPPLSVPPQYLSERERLIPRIRGQRSEHSRVVLEFIYNNRRKKTKYSPPLLLKISDRQPAGARAG
jgi:hypothetical protein